MKKQVSASFAALLLVIAFASSNAMALAPTETSAGNYQCTADELKIEPVADGTYNLVGGGTITIDVYSTANGPEFDFWTDGATVELVVVKGGPAYNTYIFNPGVESATGLHAPLNPSNGKWYGLSHLCIGSTKKDGDPKK